MIKRLIALLIFFTYHFVSAQNARFLIPYREGNKWGYCDTLGKVKIAPQFSEVSFFTYNDKSILAGAVVKKDTNLIVIDTAGKIVIPVGYKSIAPHPYRDYVIYTVVDYKKKAGIYINKKLISAPNFDNIQLAQNKNFIVSNQNKYGLMNDNGEIIIPVQFDKIRRSIKHSDSKNHIWIAYKGKEKTRFTDKLKIDFDSSINYNADEDEMLDLRKEKEETLKRNGGDKAIEKNVALAIDIVAKPKILLDSIKEQMGILKNKYQLDSIQNLYKNIFFYYVEKNNQQGIIDESLKLFLLSKKYNIVKINASDSTSWMYRDYQSLALFIIEEKGKYGIINEFDDVIVPVEYDSYSYLLKNAIITLQKGSKKGAFIINTIYKPIKPKYRDISIEKQLKISDNWGFLILAIEDEKGNKGYVGENGIEYFKN